MKSVWSDSCSIKKRDSLKGNIKTDTLVIGGGIAGLLTAYMLYKRGIEVVLIEANDIASGNIKNTTAKITSQHDLIYNKLIEEFGEDKARQYAMANELAIKRYKEIIDMENIDCDFEETEAYVYSIDKTDELSKELEAAKKLGIDAEIVDTSLLPFKIKSALKFNHQGQFNPLKFLKSISSNLTIYENTKALKIKDNLVITSGGEITANKIVIATHFPIINVPGYYFLRMHQEKSYVLALENIPNIKGMYIDIDEEGYSFRNYGDLLLLGGISHRTGDNEDGGCYDKLREVAKYLYPKAKEKYHFSAQDCMTQDRLPYIGEYSSATPTMYVATGFNKWGMTSAMVAAMIISDLIEGKDNEYAEIFSPKRFDLTLSMLNMAEDIAETTKNFIAQKIYLPSEKAEHIQKGHGGIVEFEKEKVGVYKDNEGEMYFVTTKCPHLGCELKWNPDELSWDCPCHGSSFDYKGNLLNSPSIKNNTSNIRAKNIKHI